MAQQLLQALKDPSLLVGNNLVNGEWVGSVTNKTFEVIGSCPESNSQDAQRAITAAKDAFPAWRSLSGRQRGRILRRWYELVMENRQDIATLITWENGKAKADAEAEVVFAASFLEWFSEEAARVYGHVIPHSNAAFRASATKEPIGVCGLITPWNFPAAMATRKLAPALAAGCTVVLKTAGETPFSANAVALLAQQAGVPDGVINVVTALDNTPEIGHTLCTSPIIRKISFTGSTRVGKLLMSQCSNSLKKLSLELGGNAPFIVFNDADLDLAVKGVIAGKFKVTGQTCVCANRVLVQSGVHDDFVRKLKAAVAAFKVGSSVDPSVTHGPLIHSVAAKRVDGLVKEAVSQGAKVECGGSLLPSLGSAFFQPTVLTNVSSNMRVTTEEIFGPVAPVQRFTSEQEAVDIANACDVGLASYLFTKDVGTARRVSETLQFGMVAHNTGVISDAPAPFGGIKHSGFGREGSRYGMDDYMQIKTLITGDVDTKYQSHI